MCPWVSFVMYCVMLCGLSVVWSVCVCSNVCASFANYCVAVCEFSVLFVCVCACVFLLSVFVSFV